MIKQNKVTDEELKKIKEFQERQSEIISTIGTLEYQLIFLKEQKEDIVEKLFEVEGDINDFTKMLEFCNLVLSVKNQKISKIKK